MNQDEKVNIVQAMQDYIREHVDSDLEAMYEHIGYSNTQIDCLQSFFI